MNLRRVWTILRKDLVDAIRDGRVLAVILIPLALGVFYGLIYPDKEPRPTAHVTIVGAGNDAARVAAALPQDVTRALDLKVERETDVAPARQAVEDDDTDLAVVIPDGLLRETASGRAPPLQVMIGPEPSPADQAVVELLPTTVDRLADRAPATRIAVTAVAPTSPTVIDAVGLRTFFVLAAVIMLLGFIGLLATPIILAEEIEKRTIEALLLAARGSEVLTAKALVGIIYSAVATAVTVLLTGIAVERPALFVFGVAGTALSIVGFGLVFAYLFRSADKLNTWGWVLLMPFLAPAFIVGVPAPDWLDTIAQLTPTGQGMRTIVDGVAPENVFGSPGLALAVFAVWGGGGMLILSRVLQRRGS